MIVFGRQKFLDGHLAANVLVHREQHTPDTSPTQLGFFFTNPDLISPLVLIGYLPNILLIFLRFFTFSFRPHRAAKRQQPL